MIEKIIVVHRRDIYIPGSPILMNTTRYILRIISKRRVHTEMIVKWTALKFHFNILTKYASKTLNGIDAKASVNTEEYSSMLNSNFDKYGVRNNKGRVMIIEKNNINMNPDEAMVFLFFWSSVSM